MPFWQPVNVWNESSSCLRKGSAFTWHMYLPYKSNVTSRELLFLGTDPQPKLGSATFSAAYLHQRGNTDLNQERVWFFFLRCTCLPAFERPAVGGTQDCYFILSFLYVAVTEMKDLHVWRCYWKSACSGAHCFLECAVLKLLRERHTAWATNLMLLAQWGISSLCETHTILHVNTYFK